MAVLPPHHLHSSLLIDKHRSFPQFASPAKPKSIDRPVFVPAASKSAINDDPPPAAAAVGEPAPDVAQSKKPISKGQGFGQPASPKPDPDNTNRKKQKSGRRERGAVIRRSPVERPAFLDKKDGEKIGKEQAQIESAFLLTWLGLGALILIEGIVLAASGFLPDDWDKIFVKYLYPSFTPTVGLFVAGTVSYGVLKYLQNEDAKTSK
ncbi:hypothetical protein V2J09_021143 [Rumex salicifolius]